MNAYIETRDILKKYNISANKKLGQNFLIDDEVIDGIIRAADVNENDIFAEILYFFKISLVSIYAFI